MNDDRRIVERPTRTRETRPQGTRPQGTRPQGTRPQGTRSQGTRPQGTRPQGTSRQQIMAAENARRSKARRKQNKGGTIFLGILLVGLIVFAILIGNGVIDVGGISEKDTVAPEESSDLTPEPEIEQVQDVTAPMIKTEDIYITEGDTISYKNSIFYADDICGNNDLILNVDNSQVMLDTVGNYPVSCTVTDLAGNEASATLMVYVEENITPEKEVVYEMADEVLAQLSLETKDTTTQARIIYDWIRQNIHYADHSEKDDYVQGAYDGLTNRSGDCFVFASVAKVLLTRADIPNEDIVKVKLDPSYSEHYWNLVDTGDGWYHYDTTPRKDGSEFFMLTSAELEAYSSENHDSHYYNESLYPEIN